MGQGFYDRFEESKSIYRRASKYLGFDVTALCFEGPPEALTKTELCQPALFVTSLAAFAAFKQVMPGSITPRAAAGLSVGELTAYAAAEAFGLEEGCYLVKARGEAMAQCAAEHPGAMLAVMGLSVEALKAVCRESGAVEANYNAPEVVVLSGTIEAITTAEGLAKAQGAKRAVKLDVAGAFHSTLMAPAAKALKAALTKIKIATPRFPVISNDTGTLVEDPAQIPHLLVRQITNPVRWEASMRTALATGATHFIEFPPARVLTSLLRRIDKQAAGIPVDTPSDFDKVAEALELPSQIT